MYEVKPGELGSTRIDIYGNPEPAWRPGEGEHVLSLTAYEITVLLAACDLAQTQIGSDINTGNLMPEAIGADETEARDAIREKQRKMGQVIGGLANQLPQTIQAEGVNPIGVLYSSC